MKRYGFYMMLLLACIFTAAYSNRTDKTATLTVRMEGMEDGLVCELYNITESSVPLQTGKVQEEKVSFSLPISGPAYLYLRFGPEEGETAGYYKDMLSCLLDQGEQVTITGRVSEPRMYGEMPVYMFENIRVTGSRLHKAYEKKMAPVRKLMQRQEQAISDKYADLEVEHDRIMFSDPFDDAAFDILCGKEEYRLWQEEREQAAAEVFRENRRLISDNKDSWWGPFLMMEQEMMDRELFETFSPEARQSSFGEYLQKALYPQKLTGNPMPQFRALDAQGDTVAIADCVRGHAYVLLDFWASWCGPCRASFPHLKTLYEKYHDKGFQIVGISIDTKEKAWQKALGAEQLPWITLRQFDDVASLYQVQGIPAVFLIDSEGIILPVGLSKLEEFLEKHLSGGR